MPRIPVTVANGKATTTLGPAQPREQLDRQGNRVQSAARIRTSKATALPFGDGNLVAGVSFSAGATATVQHGLGRAFAGFLVLNVAGGYGDFYRVPNTDARMDATQIQIRSANTCTGDVWVY